MRLVSYVATGLCLCLMMLVLVTAWRLKPPELDFSCSSYFQQENTGDDFYMTSNTLFTFTPVGTGFISMSGSVRHGGQEYPLRRDYQFSYHNAGGNKWQFTRVEVTFAGSDKVPAGLVERNFYSTGKKKNGTFVYIAEIKDIPGARVIGGLYSPAFMCVSTSG